MCEADCDRPNFKKIDFCCASSKFEHAPISHALNGLHFPPNTENRLGCEWCTSLSSSQSCPWLCKYLAPCPHCTLLKFENQHRRNYGALLKNGLFDYMYSSYVELYKYYVAGRRNVMNLFGWYLPLARTDNRARRLRQPCPGCLSCLFFVVTHQLCHIAQFAVYNGDLHSSQMPRFDQDSTYHLLLLQLPYLTGPGHEFSTVAQMTFVLSEL
jgi:hypothetical protein